MRFENTGLVKDALVEKAFDFAQNYTQTLAPEITEKLGGQLQDSYDEQIGQIGAALDDGRIDQTKFDALKAQLDRSLDAQQKRLPQIVQRQLELAFIQGTVSPVLELQRHSESASPALVATALLSACVRDPLDFQKIEKAFGGAVAGIIAELEHIKAYPASANDSLSTASPDAKRIYLSHVTHELDKVLDQILQLPPGAALQFPPRQEESILGKAKAVWGNDEKLDKRLVTVFNRAAEALSSEKRIAVDVNAGLTLVAAPDPSTLPGYKKGPKMKGDNDL